MEIAHARDYLGPAFDLIKARIFRHDPDDPIHFHRSDIWQCAGPFHCLKDERLRADFDAQVLQVMSDAEYKVFTVFIDKQWMQQQIHWEVKHPYDYIMSILIEKYVLYLGRMNSIGDVMPEARGKHQDKALQQVFEKCKNDGTRYSTAKQIQIRIPSKNLKFRTKKDNISGLQLCDLIAHPSNYTSRQNLGHKVKLGNFAERVSGILVNQKYDRSWDGNVKGYGFKHLP